MGKLYSQFQRITARRLWVTLAGFLFVGLMLTIQIPGYSAGLPLIPQGNVEQMSGVSSVSADQDLATAGVISQLRNDDGHPAIDYSGASYLVVWHDRIASESDPQTGIYARRVSIAGANMGSTFPISEGTSDYDRRNPDVAYHTTSGNFMVVWEQDTGSGQIFSHRVQQDGALMGSENPVADAGEYWHFPAIAANAGGPVEYLVVYQKFNGSDMDVCGQRLDINGAPVGPEILVASGSAEQAIPDVAFDPNTSRYRVVWGQAPAGSDDIDIYTQLIGLNGNLIGGPLVVAGGTDVQQTPAIAADPTRARFLVVWEQFPIGGSLSSIYARLVTADGPLTGSPITVTEGAHRRASPAVGYQPGADAFQVAWSEVLSEDNHDIYRRRLRPDGSLAEPALAVTSLPGMEVSPALAVDHTLGFLLAWDDGRDRADAGSEIYAQVLEVDQLRGVVYEGQAGDLSKPIAGVTVSLGCSPYPDAIGNTVETDVTDDWGWFRLNAPAGCAYYNIVETDPSGYISNAATAQYATVKSPNWIQYQPPLEGKILHMNYFFDRAAPTITVNFEEQTAGTYLNNHYSNKQLFFTSDYHPQLAFQAAPQVIDAAGANTPGHVMLNAFSDTDLFSSRKSPVTFWFSEPLVKLDFQIGTQSVGSTVCASVDATVIAFDCKGGVVFSQNYTGVSPSFTTSVNISDPQGRIQRVLVDYGDTVCPEAIDSMSYIAGGPACSDPTPPLVQISSPAKDSTFNQPDQVIVGAIKEPGIVRFAALNGQLLPLKMNEAGTYRFNLPVSMHDGVNTFTAGAVDYSFNLGADTASYTVGAVTSVALAEFHLTQRGVIKAGGCDIDSPFVAGKSGMVRVKLDVKTASGARAYVTSVDMKLMRQTLAGLVTVKTIPGVVYPQLYDSFFDPNQMDKIIFPFTGADVSDGGNYKFVFQPYVKAIPFGPPLELKCDPGGTGLYDFQPTHHVRVLILPVEVPINSPLLAGSNNPGDLMAQLSIAARVMPVRDFGGKTSGVDWKVLAPFQVCNGQTITTICGGTGFEWNFIDHDPGGMLLRADDEQVIDNTRTFCNPDDHIFGGRIRSNQTFPFNFTPALGIFRPGAHMNWYGAKHATPTDINHDGVIDDADMSLYIRSTFDPLQSAWEDYSAATYAQGDTFRFFSDTNNNNCNNWDDEPQAPIRVKFNNMDVVLFEPEKQALSAWNAIETDDFDSALLAFPKLLMPPSEFNDIGNGSSRPNDHTVWLQVRADDTMAHELGHSVAGLIDLYEGWDNWAPDDLGFKENAIAVYIDGQELAPISATVVMAGGGNVVHYQPDYQKLFDKLKTSNKESSADVQAGPVFELSARFMPGDAIKVLSTRVSVGLEVTRQDPTGPYALVFGAGSTVLSQVRFSIPDQLPIDPGGDPALPPVLFHAAAPLPTGAAWVELRRDGQAPIRMSSSAHPPVVHLTSPSGGESFAAGALIPVTWEAEDEDGDPLNFDLFYSPDGGSAWGLVAAGVSGSAFDWPAQSASGSDDIRLRVIASDGFHTTQDESAAFAIESHDPVAAVVSPAAGEAFPSCAAIPLRGTFYDPEGPLEAASWSLDGAPAGDGLDLDLPPLSPGEHKAALQVTDQDGRTGAHTVTFTIIADADCDGMSDDYEDAHDLDKMNYNDAAQDPDRDGLLNIDEYRYGADPRSADTDGDGFSDGREVEAHTDPTDPDSYPYYVIWMPVVSKK